MGLWENSRQKTRQWLFAVLSSSLVACATSHSTQPVSLHAAKYPALTTHPHECVETEDCALGYRCLPVGKKKRCLPRAETGRWLGSTLLLGAIGVPAGSVAICAVGACKGSFPGIAVAVGAFGGAVVGASLGTPLHLTMSRYRRPSQGYHSRVYKGWLTGLGIGFALGAGAALSEPGIELLLVGAVTGTGLGLLGAMGAMVHHRFGPVSPLDQVEEFEFKAPATVEASVDGPGRVAEPPPRGDAQVAPAAPPAATPSVDPSEPRGDAQIAPAAPPVTKPGPYHCPEGAKWVGEPPPVAYSQICMKADRSKHGKATTWWRKNGQKKNEEHYKDGKRHGKSTWWLETGQKRSEGSYKDGKKHGQWTGWYNNGQMFSQQGYKDGKLHGRYSRWYQNGYKQVEGAFWAGLPQGKWGHWGSDGQLLGTNEWDGGSGSITDWYPSGQKKSEGEYNGGKKVGVWTCWDPAGKVITCPWL